MEESRTHCRNLKIALYRETLLCKNKFCPWHNLGENGVHSGENKVIYALFMKVYRRRYLLLLPKEECAHKPLPPLLVCPVLYHKLLREHHFPLFLKKSKIISISKILVQAHLVIQIVHSCYKRELHRFAPLYRLEALGEKDSSITAGIVISKRLQKPRALIQMSVWISALPCI